MLKNFKLTNDSNNWTLCSNDDFFDICSFVAKWQIISSLVAFVFFRVGQANVPS